VRITYWKLVQTFGIDSIIDKPILSREKIYIRLQIRFSYLFEICDNILKFN